MSPHLDVLTYPHPERVTHAFVWSDEKDELNDANLYLRNLGNVTLYPGIEAALRQSLLCLRHDLYDPAAAMLGAAVEGAWVELGVALVSAAGKTNTGQPGKAIQNDRTGIKDRIDAVCKLYERDLYEELWNATEIKPRGLQEIAAWADVVRDSRNVLHWNATAKPNNSYSKVTTLLMAALSQLEKLHRIRDAALARMSREKTESR